MRKTVGICLVVILCSLSVSVADYMEGFVDMEDLAALAADWQDSADIDDLALLAANWLTVYTPPPSLAWWEMEETSGDIAYDSSGNGYNLLPQSGFSISAATTEGKIDNGFMFPGTGARLTQATLLEVMPEALTIAGWIKPDATGMSASQCWLSKQNVGSNYHVMWLKFNMSGGAPSSIGAVISSDGGTSITNLNSSVIWGDDTWYHYTFTWDASGAKIYVDGEFENSNSVSIMADGTQWDLSIASGGSTSQPFKGVIDDIRIYSSVLSDEDIQDLYDLGFGPPPDTYTLIVSDGSGDGSYVEGAVVDITADTAPAGQIFDVWTGDTAYVANVNDSTTTVTMPAAAVTVTATYETLTLHTLTVNNGTGDGDYYKNTIVDIAADAPPADQMFDAWTGDTTYVTDIDDPTTTVTMPDMAATVTATYVAVPPHSPPVANAGDDQWLDPPMNAVALLQGTATDDGIPGTGLNYTWSKVSGPGTVTFDDANLQNAKATITTAGAYVLKLVVDDGHLTSAPDYMTIKVHSNGRLTYPIVITETPKHMSDMSNYTEIYTVNLSAFGIYNDGTHPVETAAGINNMLQATKTMNPKPNRIVFPAGTYLISEFDPIIFDLKDTIVDLNGATLKLNPSGQLNTDLTIIDRGTENFRLTNGTLMGDRYDHDYSGGYSGGRAVKLLSGYNMEFDHLTIRDFTGYTFYSSNGIANATETGQYTYVLTSNMQSGGFNSSGVKIADATKIRTNNAVSLTKYLPDMEFEFGHTYGYFGLDLVLDREYQAYFYDSGMNFLEKKDCLQYKKISIPSNARYIHFEFNQTYIPSGSYMGRLTDMEPPEHVWMHDNWLYRNRGLGQAFCGGQKWIIENNHYEENGTVLDDGGFYPPAYAVDFEDGWDLMQDVVFRNNTFDGNFGDLVVCAGSEMIFEGNQFSSLVSFKSRCENRVFRNNTMYGDRFNQGSLGVVTQSNRTGHMSVHDNSYTHARLTFNNDDAYNPPLVMLENEYLYDITQFNNYDDGDDFVAIGCTMEQTEWFIADFMTYVEFDNCTFVGSQVFLNFVESGPSVTVTETNCTGTLTRTGPYTSREL